MDIRPDYANIEKDGQLVKVDPDEVQIGDIIVVQPGEKVPIDGVVIEGESTLNTSALTGESLPRSVTVNDEITSGCINLSGLLKSARLNFSAIPRSHKFSNWWKMQVPVNPALKRLSLDLLASTRRSSFSALWL